jgi:hypothetical protein
MLKYNNQYYFTLHKHFTPAPSILLTSFSLLAQKCECSQLNKEVSKLFLTNTTDATDGRFEVINNEVYLTCIIYFIYYVAHFNVYIKYIVHFILITMRFTLYTSGIYT